MANHVLSLEAPDTMNKCILRVVDTSVYNPMAPVKCPLLQVTVPGFNVPVNFSENQIQPGFIENLTACDLQLQTSQCGSKFWDLPDGIYILKWSVSPNDQVYVEYNHLRITNALWMVQEVLCDLDLAACDPPAIVKQQLAQIQLIQGYLSAAKAAVEFCHEPKRGMELYSYAIKLLKKIGCKSC